MANSTTDIANALRSMATRLEQTFANSAWNTAMPMTQQFGWNAPAFSASMLLESIRLTAVRIEELTSEQVKRPEVVNFLKSIPISVDQVQFANISSDWDAVLGSVAALISLINVNLPDSPVIEPKVNWENVRDEGLVPRDLMQRLRRIESTLTKLEPRSLSLDSKISAIELAHETADKLDLVMADLEEGQVGLKLIQERSGQFASDIEALGVGAELQSQKIPPVLAQADALIKRAEQALRGSTGVGLAAAFEERKKGLSLAGAIWVLGLVAALVVALVVGAERVNTLKDVLVSDRSAAVVVVNGLLAVLGVGGPVWFAWLSTKQIGSSFRLAKDYAFKASVAKAYEGYRAEAADINPELQARLFSSALSRLEESPIRLLDTTSHSTPLQELLANPAIYNQLEKVPNVIEKIIGLIPTKGNSSNIIPAGLAGLAAGMAEASQQTEKSNPA